MRDFLLIILLSFTVLLSSGCSQMEVSLDRESIHAINSVTVQLEQANERFEHLQHEISQLRNSLSMLQSFQDMGDDIARLADAMSRISARYSR